jgi:heat shock protein HtpX
MARRSFYTEIGRNKRDSILLVLGIFALLFVLVFVFSQVLFPELILFLLVFVAVFVIVDAFLSFRYGDKVVLRSTGAKPADPVKHAYYTNTVEGLALAAGLPKPKAYVIPNKDINAFATGRDPEHASIAVTQGALDNLNRQELEGVIAHEMSHIGNYDIRFSMLVAVFVGLVAIISYIFLRSMIFSGGGNRKGEGAGIVIIIGIVLAIVAPIAVKLVQLAISRRREYLADATGAKLTRYPPGLAKALQKIRDHNKNRMKVSDAVQHVFLADPQHSFLDNVFATHPPIAERIKRLNSM